MSRLKKHQKKQLLTSIFLYGLLLLVVFYLMFSFGIKFLINGAVFIANLGSGGKNNNPALVKSSDFFGSIDIDSIPSATNSAKIIVAGSAVNFDNLEFYLNDEKVKRTSLSSSDSFEEEIDGLEKGDNKIYIIAKSQKTKDSKKSKTFTVTYMADKPKLEISEPQDQAKVNQQDIKVSGSTNKETFITVNDSPVVVDANGNFQTSVRLREGENKLEITAQDMAGNTENKTLTVTYRRED